MSTKIFSAVLFGLFCCIASVHASDDLAGALSKGGSPSPDGAKVVFEADLTGTSNALHLWVCNMDGSDMHRIDTGLLSENNPAWSPDGNRIAFEALSPNGNTDIWTVHPDGTGLVQLTHGLNNLQPAWSPDGRRIAYASNAGGTSDIWIMDADGQNMQRLTSLPGQEDHPSFSPFGDQVVFSETDPTNFTANLQIVSSAPGAAPRALTSQGFHDWNPSWGTQGIIFSSDRPATEGSYIWKVQPDGSGLSSVDNVGALDPVWTHDGRIIFTNEVNVSPDLGAVSVYDPATKQLRRIVHGVLKVTIDIKPESDANVVNPNENGKLWVAILSEDGLDAPQDVDQSTLTFGGSGSEKSLVDCRKRPRDVNGDGKNDLECRFDVHTAKLTTANPVGIARFQTKAGIFYQGQNSFSSPASTSSTSSTP